MKIVFLTVFAVLMWGYFIWCIIEAILMNIKIYRCGKSVPIKKHKSGDMWWYIIMGITCGLNAVTSVIRLELSSFTGGVFNVLEIAAYVPGSISFIMDYFLKTRAYITDEGIVMCDAFLPPWSVKYSVKTVENQIMIKLYTKRKNPDYIYLLKNREAVSMLENNYDEFDGTAASVKIKSYMARYWLTLAFAFLIFFGGIFIWYEIKKPVVFVGDRIIKTDSEYAIFGGNSYFRSSKIGSLLPDGVIDELCDATDHSQKIKSKDMAALKKLPNLKYLDVTQNNITDLTVIGELTQLEFLRFGGGNKIEKPADFSPLKNLTNIKYFSGFGLYELTDLTLFENMDGLVYFELTSADIKDGLDVICEKEELLFLELFLCTAEDFSPIGKCTKLKYLGISKTNAADLSFLKNLAELETLDIDGINADDYSALTALPRLKDLYAMGTEIPQEIIDELTEKGVTVHN